MLKSLSETVASRIRKTDFFARYGGEEFCCLLPETPAEAAALLAEALRKSIAEHEFAFNAENIRVTISLGVAEVATGVDQPAHLIKHADEALYRAKGTGRNRVVVYSEMTSA